MLNLQVTLSDFRYRKRQLKAIQSFIVVLRFGSIKLDIKLNLNGDQLIGGKKILLDISSEDLKNMFINYALAMFIDNQQGKFFCIASLQKLQFSDIISGQQVYFYNDNQEIAYSANFSMIFNDFKNPRLPNKQKIQNHKTFNQYFQKPSVPGHTVDARALNSFLYAKKKFINQKQKLSSTSVKNIQLKPSSAKPKKQIPSGKTQKQMKKNSKIPELLTTYQPQFRIYNAFDEDQDMKDGNPPVMQFTNTVLDPFLGKNLLKNQMAQLHMTAPQSIKFMEAYDSKNKFLKVNQKDTKNTIIKIQEKFKNSQQNLLGETKFYKTTIEQIKINRDDLRNKAKIQMQNYQGTNNIKIPVFKDGKYEYVELAHLNQAEISNFAKKQRQIQIEEAEKKAVSKLLQKRQKQNSLLKKQLQEKQKLIIRQQQQAKRQKIQLLKTKQLAQENKKLANAKQISQNSKHSQNSSDMDSDENQAQNSQNQSNSKDQKAGDEENYYQSDFQSMSMASAKKKSRISMNSQKKQEESQSYNDSYDPDFESYSQSLLGSQPKLSMSQISQSLRSASPKKR